MSSGPARPDHEDAVVYRRAADAFRRSVRSADHPRITAVQWHAREDSNL
jgi:hypothetical protein